MLSKILSAVTIGIDAKQIEIEVDIANGLPAIVIVGLPDTAIRESKDRVKAAIKNSLFKYPAKRITVNLAPGNIKKEGPCFDLPIAIGILTAMGEIDFRRLKDFVLLGELALTGKIRPVKGILPIALSLKDSNKKLIVPAENAYEANVVKGIEIYPVDTLINVCNFLKGAISIPSIQPEKNNSLPKTQGHQLDFSDVKGQIYAKRAMEIAAAGNHNIILIGPPGSGKTMIAKRLPTILPEMSINESIESTKIYSISGLISQENPLVKTRPFRSPHHTASYASLVGGGTAPKPGEVSLAHNGVLFLDELPEFHRNVLEALRQPMEDRFVTIARASGTLSFPSNFMLVCSMNPCPCGFLTDPKKECICNSLRIQKYLSKISGPLLDRIDIHIEIPPVQYNELSTDSDSEKSETIKQRVEKARQIQLERLSVEDGGIFCNASMSHKQTRKFCPLGKKENDLLKMAMTELNLSARAYGKILKVARTIADLECKESIESGHISEAIQLRSLDRNLWA